MSSTALARLLPPALVALRLAFAALFGWAGLSKLRDPTAFAQEIDRYQLLPELAPYLAASLPTLEVVLALALLVLPALWRRAAALASFALLTAFTVAAASAYARNLDISCGCFGTDSGPISELTLARNLLLLAACALLVRRA